MFNEPVLGERFFGRGEVLDLLNKRVSALKEGYRQNIALTGQSLAGKSSIILHFIYTIKDEAFIPVYLEVNKESFRSFSNKFIATLLYSSLAKMGEDVEVDMTSLLERAQKVLPKTYAAIKNVNVFIDRKQVDEAYSNLLGLTSVLKDEIQIPCIVILDEFDNLDFLGVKNPFLNFGKVIMVQKDTMYIVSSSRNQAIKKILSEKLSLLFGNFEIVKISGFDANMAREFIEAKLADYEADESIKRFLISFTDGNPFYMDKIITRAKDIASDKMTNHIGQDTVTNAILDLVYDSGGIIHQYLANFILDTIDTRYRDSCILILSSIANGQNKQSEIAKGLRAKQRDIAKHLSRLMELGFISKCGVFYNIDDAVLEFWLKYAYQRRKELLVNGILDKRAIFEKEANSYISRFTQELTRDPMSRLLELFNLFSNELVQIDSKCLKLPHFTKVEVKFFSNGNPYIAASFRGKYWIVQLYESEVGENNIVDYIRDVKALDVKISNRVIVPLKGMDENARLLAKELRITIWDEPAVNMLLRQYKKNRISLL